jgi:dihydropteroate synthase
MAIDHGASIINDVSGLTFDAKLAKVVAKKQASLVIMHMRGKPKTMQKNPEYKDLMKEIYSFLEKQVTRALETGIDRNRIIIDPGLGFGKKLEDNYTIMRRLAEFKGMGRPIMVGHSRKSFIGKPFKLAPENRLEGSLAVQGVLISNGAAILRVHDVLEAKRAAELIDLIQR